jgi:hypothetical protein
MIRRIGRADGSVVLVAIGLEPDGRGDYRIRTCYLLEAHKVAERRQQGRLRIAVARQIEGPAWTEPSITRAGCNPRSLGQQRLPTPRESVCRLVTSPFGQVREAAVLTSAGSLEHGDWLTISQIAVAVVVQWLPPAVPPVPRCEGPFREGRSFAYGDATQARRGKMGGPEYSPSDWRPTSLCVGWGAPLDVAVSPHPLTRFAAQAHRPGEGI